ncbi:hypothetical protein SLEP1_g38050 [Rubroshorea leprosula]|uniref:Uncharacterized protein n=1 Tax=Rubroshorea leprosula TaxID=152421 RepID=A0AAV5KX76_9ROSI|nr:hypothetical protein SLEP1_g38050 [Rubroshorea leprosula]
MVACNCYGAEANRSGDGFRGMSCAVVMKDEDEGMPEDEGVLLRLEGLWVSDGGDGG